MKKTESIKVQIIMMRRLLSFIVMMLILTGSIVKGQTGTLKGKIIEKETGEPLIGANVIVAGTTTGTISDFDGNYSLTLKPGTYTIQISFISYEKLVFENVEIKESEQTVINANLGTVTTEMDEVRVVARQRQRTEEAMQVLQKKSPVVLDGISSQQISKLGDSDAAAALKRVTGVSVMEGKYVYVRGLSDRYMKATLNGAQIPGIDPNMNTVQMDLFPSNVIENMVVHKTYSPDYPAFTGGHVDIITKDFPDNFNLQFSASAGFNPQANLQKNFITHEKGDLDWLGMDDGTRSVPDIARDNLIPSVNRDNIETANQVSAAFKNNLEPIGKTSAIDQGYSFSIGNKYEFADNKVLGIIGSVSYKKEYSFYSNGIDASYYAINDSSMISNHKFNETRGQENVIWSVLFSPTLKLNANNKIGITYLKNQNGNVGARYQQGIESYDDNRSQWYQMEYLERGLNSYQLRGKHVLPELNRATIDWQSSFIHSVQREPDNRVFMNIFEVDASSEDVDTSYEMYSTRDPRRRYRDMYENNWDSKLNFSLPFNLKEQKGKFKTGFSYVNKSRNSDELEYAIRQRGFVNYNGSPNDFVADKNLVHPDRYREPGVFYASDRLTSQIISYRAEEEIAAAYLLAELPVFKNLRIIIGARAEYARAFLENKVDTTAFPNRVDAYKSNDTSNLDWLPSINATYTLLDNMNLRMGYSRTLARPSFRERAPYVFYDYFAGETVQGNPGLVRGIVDNFDLRWEYFFNRGEMVSLSGFYKKFYSPIEKYYSQSKNSTLRFRNGNDAELYGLETEFRTDLDFVPLLQDFSTGINISLIKTIVDVDSARLNTARVTNPDFPDTRPMYGQAPWLVNFFLSYNNADNGIAANLGFNVSGEKIVQISQYQTPDIYEQPRPRLNFNLKKEIGERVVVKLSAKNLLNSPFEQTYTLAGKEYDYKKHTSGREFSLGISYKIE